MATTIDAARKFRPIDPPSIPELPGGLPLLGHLIGFLRDPVPMLRRGYEALGPVFRFRMAGRRFTVLLGPENNAFFFQQTDKLLSIRESMPFFHKMFSRNFYSFAEQDEYLRQRGIIMPRFKAVAMKAYVPVMAGHSVGLCDRLGKEGRFDVIPTLGPVVMDIAAHSFMGRDFHERLGHEFFALFRDFSGGMEFVLPLWLPTPKMVRSQRAKRKLHRILGAWIAERRATPADPPDFFQEMIASTYPDGSPVPDETLINLILLLVWAGHETTAGQVSWALIDLLQNPRYLAEVREELTAVLGASDGTDMSWEQALALTRLDAAIRESERLHPVAFILSRVAAEDIDWNGIQVKKGDWVLLSPAISHRLEEVFGNADGYCPHRFDAGEAETIGSNALIGFGGGVHRCAGVNFARMEMKVLLAVLLQNLDFELFDEPRPVAGATTYWPAQPCRVTYRKRRRDGEADPSAIARAAAAAGCPAHAND